MSAGLRAYREIFRDRSAIGFSAAGFVARMPLSMSGIGIVLLVSLTTGSFGRAGLITGVSTVFGAITAPIWGRTIDRLGQSTVLIVAALANAIGLSVLITSVLEGWPLAVSLAAAVVVGIGFSSAGSAVRARWSARLGGTPLLNTAFAFEAMLDEVVFIIGPVLVTFLATTIHPALGIIASGSLGLVGALVLAGQRRTQPPPVPRSATADASRRLPIGLLLPIGLASVALGMIFGGMEVVVVAFAEAAGVLRWTGTILMAWALGSLVSGAVYGAIHWRSGPAHRFRIGAVALAVSTVPLLFLDHPVLLAGALMISGMAIAPTMIASTGVVQSGVDAGRLSEALAWNSTGLATGLAIGAAALGQVIDEFSWRAGFVGVAVAGGLLIIAAQFVRARPRRAALSPAVPDTAPAVPARRLVESRRR